MASSIRRDDLGQMIRVRAADGTIIHRWGRASANGCPTSRSRRSCATRWSRSRTGASARIPASIRSASSARVWRRLTGGTAGAQGGSTITQQLARNIFLTNDRTFARKVREGILALALEWRFSKDQILELYLNRVYFGGGAYGIDAASRRFFGHSATELSVAEAAIIAGLVKAPSNYSPTADVEAARGRAGVVARPDGRRTARSARPRPPPPIPHDVELARDHRAAEQRPLFHRLGAAAARHADRRDRRSRSTSGRRSTSTCSAPPIAAINANAPRGAQGALVALDRDGAVRAMVGGRDYVDSIYNRATQANRQPGSSFKLFVYLAALEAGYRPDTDRQDEPITIDGWTPRNDNGRYAGPVPLRDAFAYSINTVAVRLAQEVGTRTVADMAQRFGITTPDRHQSVDGAGHVRRCG